MKNVAKKTLKFIGNHKVRLALCATLIAILFVVPMLTSAQYVWKLNGYSIVQAKEFYFASNYMTAKGTTKKITGWSGTTNPIKEIEVRNYENALLANKEGEDTDYVYTWEMTTVVYDNGSYKIATATNQYKDYMYTFKEVALNYDSSTGKSDGLIPTGSTKGTAKRTLIGDGNPNEDGYTFSLNFPSVTPPTGSYIVVKMEAKNVKLDSTASKGYVETDSFARTISCTLRYYISTSSGFVTRFDADETEGYKNLTFDIGTGDSPDMTGETLSITVWWDNTVVDVNAFNKTFQDAIAESSANYQAQYSSTLTNISSVKLTGIGSKYSGNLDFYKKTDMNLTYDKTSYESQDVITLTNLENWFYDDYRYVAAGTTELFNTSDLLVAANMLPTDTGATGKYFGYYAEIAQ